MNIVVVSGWSDMIDAETQERYGVNAVIGKPYQFDTIQKLLRDSVC